jgi:hypothetical protein
MQRRDFLKIGVGAVALPTALGTHAAELKRPNVLFFLADDMKADCLGALGNPHLKTPNLDPLVQRGFTFSRAYCFYTHINKTQLFDWQTDPRETNDLADNRKHAGKVEEMMALLAKAQKQWGDTCPLVSPAPASPEWTPPAKEQPAAARRARRSVGKGNVHV